MTRRESPLARSVESVRAFNRFYTREIGLPGDRHLASGLSLTEVRSLYEIAQRTEVSPTALSGALALDAGYVSRLLRSLEKRAYVARTVSKVDARRATPKLTARGRRIVERLEAARRVRLSGILEQVTANDRDRLVQAMRTIETVLVDDPSAVPSPPWTIRHPRPGDLGWVVHRQAAMYAAECGWDWSYEGLAMRICSDFVRDFDPAGEHCRVVERDGVIVGSVFVVRKSARTAQLRLLSVDPAARGRGIGRALVEGCIAFARERGYRRITLWTNDVLVAARRLYEAAGFKLVDEERHRAFGHDLVGQNWSRTL